MNCPFCGKSMKQGFVCSGTGGAGICWAEGEEYKNITSKTYLDLHFLKDAQLKAYRCLHCKKIIVDAPEKEGRTIYL